MDFPAPERWNKNAEDKEEEQTLCCAHCAKENIFMFKFSPFSVTSNKCPSNLFDIRVYYRKEEEKVNKTIYI